MLPSIATRKLDNPTVPGYKMQVKVNSVSAGIYLKKKTPKKPISKLFLFKFSDLCAYGHTWSNISISISSGHVGWLRKS